MKRTMDAESLAAAQRLLDEPLPWLAKLPAISELPASLEMLESDEAYSIRHRPPPPLWTEVGNTQVQAYYRSHPEHPMAGDDRARERRRTAFMILNLARQAPSAFTTQHMESLHVCLFDCDVSIRHDLVKALGFIGSTTSVASLAELIEREPESDTVIAMATVIHNALTQAGRAMPAGP